MLKVKINFASSIENISTKIASHSTANSPENVAKWAEMKKAEAAAHH